MARQAGRRSQDSWLRTKTSEEGCNEFKETTNGCQLFVVSLDSLASLRRAATPRKNELRSGGIGLSVNQLINTIRTDDPATTGRSLAQAGDGFRGGPIVVDGQLLALHDIA